jgi:hypothetical protein
MRITTVPGLDVELQAPARMRDKFVNRIKWSGFVCAA